MLQGKIMFLIDTDNLSSNNPYRIIASELNFPL